MGVNIEQVGAIQQDLTSRTIKVLSKQNYIMWEQSYSNEDTFNKVFREITKRFNVELKRRENETHSND